MLASVQALKEVLKVSLLFNLVDLATERQRIDNLDS